jgi:hypothetical protein
MSEPICNLGTERAERIVDYVYGLVDAAERAAFESHVRVCLVCQTELTELDAVRAHLGQWSPPEPQVLSFAIPADAPSEPPAASPRPAGMWTRAAAIPAWAQVAAAILVMGVSALIANLDVRVDDNGFSVRTGWMSVPRPALAGAPAEGLAAPAGRDVVSSTFVNTAERSAARTDGLSPWRQDLTALESQLREEFKMATGRETRRSSDEELLRRMRTLVEESERKQQRELALRVAEVARESQAQRQADLVRIDRSLGFIQSNTGAEMLRNRQMLNNLAVRVSQTRD